MNSVRLPNKNILPLGKKPLCHHVVSMLLESSLLDQVFVYCSNIEIKKYIPSKASVLIRPESLDLDETKGMEIYNEFAKQMPSDIYVLVHTTSPYLNLQTINSAVEAVKTQGYDSAFTVCKFDTFAWFKNKPINYDPYSNIPRTQDLDPVFVETSGVFVYTKEVLQSGSRIGNNPKFIEVGMVEGIDIDTKTDYELAKKMWFASGKK